jgi:hypothetical protein
LVEKFKGSRVAGMETQNTLRETFDGKKSEEEFMVVNGATQKLTLGAS